MKTITTICCLAGTALGVFAQVAPDLSNAPQPTPYTAVDIGPNHTVWQRFEYEPGPSGDFVPRVHHFTERATGLHFWANNKWNNTREEILPLPLPDGGAAATNGPHQAFFPADIYSGTIELVTPDGVHLKSRPIGIAYANGTNSVMIASLTNSLGQLLPSGNQIIYTNVLGSTATGANADLVITYRKSGVDCDLVFRSRLPAPDAWEMDPNDVHTRIQLWTEFFDMQQPATVASYTSDEDGLTDSTLQFGANTVMVPGKTFSAGTAGAGGQTSVYKSWIQNIDGGRTVLIEEMPYCRLKGQLDELAAIDRPAKHLYASANSQRHTTVGQRTGARESSAALPAPVASGKLAEDSQNPAGMASPSPKRATARPQFRIQLPPRRGIATTKGEQVLLAKGDLSKEPGVWADYATISGTQTNVLFQSDTTYYVSSTLSLCGTNTWEPGTVLKLASNASVTIVSGPLTPSLVFETAKYKPVIFTCVDDSAVGEVTGTGNPIGYYANPALNLQNVGNQSFSNVRFLYAQQAVSLGSGNLTNYDTQIANCQNGFALSSATLRLGNCLIANVQKDFSCSTGVAVVSQNSTFASATNLAMSAVGGCACHLTNCVLSSIGSLTNGVTLDGAFNGFYNTAQFGSNSISTNAFPFQTVGGGSFYLLTNSVFHGFGTTNIDPALLVDISQKTTYPAIVYSNVTLSAQMTFSPQAQRDTNVMDLGFHYDPVDYFFGGVSALSNLTFTTGTAAGWFELPGNGGPGYGVSLLNGMSATFTGTVINPCIFTRYSDVQEGGNGLWTDKGWLAGIIAGQGVLDWSNPGTIVASFLHSYLVAGGPGHWRDYYSALAVKATHCEFTSGNLGGYNTDSHYTNCLMDRIYLGQETTEPSAAVILRNNTWHGGNLQFIHDEGGPPHWFTSIRDSAFDSTSINTGYTGDPTSVDYDYNAFLVNSNRTNPTGPHDVIVTNGYTWQTSWFGNYYLPTTPTNSPLIHAGDTNANHVGLYHFTITTNQVVEGTNIVSIGYHFVATDTNGIPLDTNGDGIPDYLQDPSGGGGPLSITLLAPLNNSSFSEPATIPLQASIFDWSGLVTNVQFLQGTTGIINIGSAPYQYSWPIVAAGSYAVTAVARDNAGAVAVSSVANVTVTNLCSQ